MIHLVVGELETNCYIIYDEYYNAAIIDPGDEVSKIIHACEGLNVKEILVTHHHFDHVGALKEVENYFGLMHNDFVNKYFSYDVIEVPGHTKDSLVFYFKKLNMMFVGDFLFLNSFGRTDLGGNNQDMIKSLRFISQYDDNVKIYPGHGEGSILGNEKKNFDYYVKILANE